MKHFPVQLLVGGRSGGTAPPAPTLPSNPIDGDAATNTFVENAASGTALGVTAQSTGTTPISYALSTNPSGLCSINSSTGVITRSGSGTASVGSIAVGVTATNVAGSSSEVLFTIAVTLAPPGMPTDANAGANTFVQDAAAASLVGITAQATGGGTISYAITTNPGNLCSINTSSGVVSRSVFGTPSVGALVIGVTATNAGGSSAEALFTINVTAAAVPTLPTDVDAHLNEILDTAQVGDLVHVTAFSTGATSYTLTTNPGSRYAIGSVSGIVTLASTSGLSIGTEDIGITAHNAAGDSAAATFTITIADAIDNPRADFTAATYPAALALLNANGGGMCRVTGINLATALAAFTAADPYESGFAQWAASGVGTMGQTGGKTAIWSFSGGVFDQVRMVIHYFGGGHTDTPDNSVISVWLLTGAITVGIPRSPKSDYVTTMGYSWAGVPQPVPEHAPPAFHTWGSSGILPDGRFLVFVGDTFAPWGSGGVKPKHIWRGNPLDVAVAGQPAHSWELLAYDQPHVPGSMGTTKPLADGRLVVGRQGPDAGFSILDHVAGTWGTYHSLANSYEWRFCVDEPRGLIWQADINDGLYFRSINLSTGAIVSTKYIGYQSSPPHINEWHGWGARPCMWMQDGKVCIYHGSGGVLQTFDPDTDTFGAWAHGTFPIEILEYNEYFGGGGYNKAWFVEADEVVVMAKPANPGLWVVKIPAAHHFKNVSRIRAQSYVTGGGTKTIPPGAYQWAIEGHDSTLDLTLTGVNFAYAGAYGPDVGTTSNQNKAIVYTAKDLLTPHTVILRDVDLQKDVRYNPNGPTAGVRSDTCYDLTVLNYRISKKDDGILTGNTVAVNFDGQTGNFVLSRGNAIGFDSETVNFQAGETIVGQTSGASGVCTFVHHNPGGNDGVFMFSSVTGTFNNHVSSGLGELINGSLGGRGRIREGCNLFYAIRGTTSGMVAGCNAQLDSGTTGTLKRVYSDGIAAIQGPRAVDNETLTDDMGGVAVANGTDYGIGSFTVKAGYVDHCGEQTNVFQNGQKHGMYCGECASAWFEDDISGVITGAGNARKSRAMTTMFKHFIMLKLGTGSLAQFYSPWGNRCIDLPNGGAVTLDTCLLRKGISDDDEVAVKMNGDFTLGQGYHWSVQNFTAINKSVCINDGSYTAVLFDDGSGNGYPDGMNYTPTGQIVLIGSWSLGDYPNTNIITSGTSGSYISGSTLATYIARAKADGHFAALAARLAVLRASPYGPVPPGQTVGQGFTIPVQDWE